MISAEPAIGFCWTVEKKEHRYSDYVNVFTVAVD